jgi:hypothetical protein
MSGTVKRGYLDFPAEWEHLESIGVGAFTTQVEHRLPDGSIHIWSSRRHRKGYGPEVVPVNEAEPRTKKRLSLLVWAPDSLNWWIAVLFMIGASCFILGSLLVLAGVSAALLIDLIFFVGSIFFTSAGYSQYNQSINAATSVGISSEPHKRTWVAWQPGRIDFWVTFSQLLGTIAFNFSTFDAFLDLGWFGYDLTVWVPDMLGSILFLISGTLAVFEICPHFWCSQSRSFGWWITEINFVGCVAFMISAILAFARPDPILDNLAVYATIFTLIGAVCFFTGAYLMWPEMSVEAGEKEL